MVLRVRPQFDGTSVVMKHELVYLSDALHGFVFSFLVGAPTRGLRDQYYSYKRRRMRVNFKASSGYLTSHRRYELMTPYRLLCLSARPHGSSLSASRWCACTHHGWTGVIQ